MLITKLCYLCMNITSIANTSRCCLMLKHTTQSSAFSASMWLIFSSTDTFSLPSISSSQSCLTYFTSFCHTLSYFIYQRSFLYQSEFNFLSGVASNPLFYMFFFNYFIHWQQLFRSVRKVVLSLNLVERVIHLSQLNCHFQTFYNFVPHLAPFSSMTRNV